MGQMEKGRDPQAGGRLDKCYWMNLISCAPFTSALLQYVEIITEKNKKNDTPK
jgi:hypothetical protein